MARFTGKRALVIGDLMVDEYIRGNVSRVSPEAPVPVLDIVAESFVPGGAANVAKQLIDLGAEVMVAGVVGADAAGERLKENLGIIGADVSAVIVAYDRPTTQKTRIVAGAQQIVRVDREKRDPLPDFTATRLIQCATKLLPRCDVILFSDYLKGVLGRETVRALIAAGQEKGIIITANPKPASAKFYEGIDVAQFNRSEADQTAQAYALPGNDPFESPDAGAFHEAGTRLRTALSVKNLLVTRGGEGVTVFHEGDLYTDMPAHRVEVFDGTGAGDSTIAALTLALASSASITDAIALGNASGGAVVRKAGVVTATREEIASLFI